MRILAIIGAFAIVTGIGAAVFFFGGYYNVAGTTDDPSIIRWALIQVRSASINRHANDVPPATISDPASVQAGAKVFSSLGCATCHGAPGVNWAKFS
jgi:cytochrome c553